MLNKMAKEKVIVKVMHGLFWDCSESDASMSLTSIQTKKWKCKIKGNGTIECNCLYTDYNDGVSTNIRYTILKNGYAKLTYKKEHNPVKILKRGYVTPKGLEPSGTIILSNEPTLSLEVASFTLPDPTKVIILDEVSFTSRARLLAQIGSDGFYTIQELVETLCKYSPNLELQTAIPPLPEFVKASKASDEDYFECANILGILDSNNMPIASMFFERDDIRCHQNVIYDLFLHGKKYASVRHLVEYLNQYGIIPSYVTKYYPVVRYDYKAAIISVDVLQGLSRKLIFKDLLIGKFYKK